MKAIAKHRDLLSAGLALGFVVFVLASVAVRTFSHPVAASNAVSIEVPANHAIQN